MDLAGLDAFNRAALEPAQMLVLAAPLQFAHPVLFLDQLAGRLAILRDQDIQGKLYIGHDLSVQVGQLAPAFLRERQSLVAPFADQLQQVLGDDIADMLQVDGEVRQDHAALCVLGAHRAAVQLDKVMLDIRIDLVDLPIEAAQLLDLVLVAGLVELHHRTQHDLDDLAHPEQLTRRARQRQARRVPLKSAKKT